MRPKERWKLMDIHAHILPGVDDGAENMDETMAMIKQADEEGISVIVATPHYGMRNPDYDPKAAEKTLTAVREVMRRSHPHMKLYMGNELYYSPGIISELQSGRARTIGGTDYVLVEFSIKIEFHEMISAVRAFLREGYRPILAHIERYQCLYREMDRIYELIDEGAYMQVNTRGFLRGKRDKRAAWCRALLEEGVIHFVASDCHSSMGRSPIMDSALTEMIKLAGEEEVKRIVNTNIIKLIRNEYI